MRTGIDEACTSGECMDMTTTREWETEAYCRPESGFLVGSPCTQDSDCSLAGQGN